MSWWATGISAASNVIGAVGGGSPKTYTPRRATKQAERQRLLSMRNFLYGTEGNAGDQQGGIEELYTNPDLQQTYGPMPFDPNPNQFEQNALGQLGSYANDAFPALYGQFADSVAGGIQGDPQLQQYAQDLGQMMPMLQGGFGAGPGQINAPQIGFNPQVGLQQGPQFQNPGMQRTGENYLQGAPQINYNPQTGNTQRSGLGYLGGAQFNPGQYTPQTQNTVNADPNAAIQNMLSGTADTRGLQGAMDSYLQPLMEQFNEQVIPGLQRADNMYTGGQGSAGTLKASQRVAEQIGEGAAAHGQGLLYQANQDALNRQTQGAGLATQAGLQQSGQGLQAAGLGLQGASAAGNLGLGHAGLGAQTAQGYDLADQSASQFRDQMGFQQAGANAGYGLDYARLGSGLAQGYDFAGADQGLAYNQLNANTGLGYYGQNLGAQQANNALRANIAGQNAGLNMQGQMANQGAMTDWRGQLLQGVGLGAGAASDSANNAAKWGSLYPQMMNAGLGGPQAQLMAGTLQRQLTDAPLEYQFNQHMFNQRQPYDNAQAYNAVLNGQSIPGLSAQPDPQSGGSRLLSGVQSLLGNWPTGGFPGNGGGTPAGVSIWDQDLTGQILNSGGGLGADGMNNYWLR